MNNSIKTSLGPITYQEWLREHSLSSAESIPIAVRVRSGPAGRATITKVPVHLGLSNLPISPRDGELEERHLATLVDDVREHSATPVRAPKGSRGLSTYGAWRIRDGGAIFDELPDYTRGAYTLTCPADDNERIERWNASFSELIRVFHRDWERAVEKKVPPNKRGSTQLKYWCYVIEEQERGAWHSHHMLPLKVDSTDRDLFSIQEWDEFTLKCIRKVYGNIFDDCPLESFGRVERIRYSVGGYYAKYMSKGSGDHSLNPPPTHWWGMSKALRAEIENRTFDEVYYLHRLDWEQIENELRGLDCVQWSYPALIPAEGLPREYWTQVGLVIIQKREREWGVASYFESTYGEDYYQFQFF